MPRRLNTALQWMMEEMDPLDEQLQFLTSDEDDLPKNTRGPSKDRRRFEGQLKLHEDYISENSAYGNREFKRRFRVSKEIFRSICNDLVCHDEYFLQKRDCCGVLGLSTEQKITAALRILAYGVAADATDEYVRLADTTSRNTLHRFAKGLVELYQEKFLRAPNVNDLCKILYDNAQRGFPGCIGSLDCTHWSWKNCPVALAGQYKGKEKYPTLVLEAVATQDTRIWHAFFGSPGSLNDLNILDRSPLFEDTLYKRSPQIEFTINNNRYHYGYYLTDGIYPSWPTMMKSKASSNDPQSKKFTKAQESARKDIERAFGALKGRFQILDHPGRMFSASKMHNIMMCCVILHNMIIDEQAEPINVPKTLPYNTRVIPPIPNQPPPNHTEISFRRMDMHSEFKYTYLQQDLVNIHWHRYCSRDSDSGSNST